MFWTGCSCTQWDGIFCLLPLASRYLSSRISWFLSGQLLESSHSRLLTMSNGFWYFGEKAQCTFLRQSCVVSRFILFNKERKKDVWHHPGCCWNHQFHPGNSYFELLFQMEQARYAKKKSNGSSNPSSLVKLFFHIGTLFQVTFGTFPRLFLRFIPNQIRAQIFELSCLKFLSECLAFGTTLYGYCVNSHQSCTEDRSW